ncbi:hypothetical protein Tco_0506546 [Tanacetum coccineum]
MSYSSYKSNITCECELPSRVLTAWTPTNPAQRFLVCPNRSRPVRKKCAKWDWFDEELDSDWYRMHLYEMYTQLNPNQRRHLDTERSRQARIEELEVVLDETHDDHPTTAT